MVHRTKPEKVSIVQLIYDEGKTLHEVFEILIKDYGWNCSEKEFDDMVTMGPIYCENLDDILDVFGYEMVIMEKW